MKGAYRTIDDLFETLADVSVSGLGDITEDITRAVIGEQIIVDKTGQRRTSRRTWHNRLNDIDAFTETYAQKLSNYDPSSKDFQDGVEYLQSVADSLEGYDYFNRSGDKSHMQKTVEKIRSKVAELTDLPAHVPADVIELPGVIYLPSKHQAVVGAEPVSIPIDYQDEPVAIDVSVENVEPLNDHEVVHTDVEAIELASDIVTRDGFIDTYMSAMRQVAQDGNTQKVVEQTHALANLTESLYFGDDLPAQQKVDKLRAFSEELSAPTIQISPEPPEPTYRVELWGSNDVVYRQINGEEQIIGRNRSNKYGNFPESFQDDVEIDLDLTRGAESVIVHDQYGEHKLPVTLVASRKAIDRKVIWSKPNRLVRKINARNERYYQEPDETLDDLQHEPIAGRIGQSWTSKFSRAAAIIGTALITNVAAYTANPQASQLNNTYIQQGDVYDTNTN